MQLARNFATVGAMTAVSRVLGFVRDTFLAAALGAGPVADAFFVAFKLPNLFRRLFAEGAFNSAFVPLFTRVRAEEGAEGGEVVDGALVVVWLGHLEHAGAAIEARAALVDFARGGIDDGRPDGDHGRLGCDDREHLAQGGGGEADVGVEEPDVVGV